MSDRAVIYDPGFAAGQVQAVPDVLAGEITPEWAWGNSTGRGVKVAVIDSGIDADHPAVGAVTGYVAVEIGPDGTILDTAPHRDLFGHGTACAGIIRNLAPECELYSVRVLGEQLIGRGAAFAAGLRWAVEAGMQVCNLSLGTTRAQFFADLQAVADLAAFRHVTLVAAANNSPQPSYPSMFASVISVTAQDTTRHTINPTPPAEFGAPGVNIRTPWLDGGWLTTTGNSFAAPHISGLVARLLERHPEATPAQVRTILRALAANATPSCKVSP